MVVTPSRLHAVRSYRNFRRQILEEKGYDLDVTCCNFREKLKMRADIYGRKTE